MVSGTVSIHYNMRSILIRRIKRTVFRKLHRWVGLALCVPFALQGLTGLVLLLLPKLAFNRPQLHDNGPLLPADTQIADAIAHAPAGMSIVDYAPPRWPGDTAAIGFGPPHARHPLETLMVDPTTGQVVHVTSRVLFRFAHDLHTDLLLIPYGQTATELMGILLTLMCITGIALWCPTPALMLSARWKRAIVPPTRIAGYRGLRDLHQTVGFWSALLVGFMGASGAIMSLPHAHNDGPPQGAADHAHHGPRHGGPNGGADHEGLGHDGMPRQDGPPTPPASEATAETGSTPFVADALAQLHASHPNAIVQDVTLNMPGTVRLRTILPERGANHPVMIDSTSRGLRIPPAQPQTLRDTIRAAAHMLHEANIAGPGWFVPIWTTLIALSGIILIGLSVTGTWMTIRRKTSTARPVDIGAGVQTLETENANIG